LNARQPDIAAQGDKRKAVDVEEEVSEERAQFEERTAEIFRALSVVFADDGVNQSLMDVRAMLASQPGLFQSSGESEADINRMLLKRTQELESALNVVRAANKTVCPKNNTSAFKLIRSLVAHIMAAAHTPPSRISALNDLEQYRQHQNSIDRAIQAVKSAVLAFKTRKTQMASAAGPSADASDEPMPDQEVTDSDYKAFEAESSILYLRGRCDVVPNNQRGPVMKIIQDHIDSELVPEPTCNLLADLLKLIYLMCTKYTGPESNAYEMVYANTRDVRRPDTRFLSNAKPKSLMPHDKTAIGQDETFVEHIIGDLNAGSSEYSTELARALWEELSKSINARPSTELEKDDVAPYIFHQYDGLDSDRETPPDAEIAEWNSAFTAHTNLASYSDNDLLKLKKLYIRIFLRYARYAGNGSWFANSAAMVSCMVALSQRPRWTETQIATQQREVAEQAVASVFPDGVVPPETVADVVQQLTEEAVAPVSTQVQNYIASQDTGEKSPPGANSGGQVNGDMDDRESQASPPVLELPDALDDDSTSGDTLEQVLAANTARASSEALERSAPSPAATRQQTVATAEGSAQTEDTSDLVNQESAASQEQAKQVQEAQVALGAMKEALEQSEQRLTESGTELESRQRELEAATQEATSLGEEIERLKERLNEAEVQETRAKEAAQAAAAQARSMQDDADNTTSKLTQAAKLIRSIKDMLSGHEQTIQELQQQIVELEKKQQEAKKESRIAQKRVAKEQTSLDDALKQSINALREQCDKQAALLKRRRTSSTGEISRERQVMASKFEDYSKKLKQMMLPKNFSLDAKREVEIIRLAIKKLADEAHESKMSRASANLDAFLEYIASTCDTWAETTQADSRNLNIATTVQHAVAVLSVMSSDNYEQAAYYVGANLVHIVVSYYAKQAGFKNTGRLGRYVMLYRSARLLMTQNRALGRLSVSQPLVRMLPMVIQEGLMRALGFTSTRVSVSNNDHWNFFLTIALTGALNYGSLDFLYRHVMRADTGRMVIGRTLQVVGSSMAELISIAHTYDQIQSIISIIYSRTGGTQNERLLRQWGRLLWVNRSGPTRAILTLSVALALFYYPQLKKKLLKAGVKALRAAKRLRRPQDATLLLTFSPEALQGADDSTDQGGSSSDDTGGVPVIELPDAEDDEEDDEEDGEEDGEAMGASVDRYMDTLVGRRITNPQLGTFTVVSKSQRQRGPVDVCAVLAVLHHTDVHSLCLR
jgi:hypothetical protein